MKKQKQINIKSIYDRTGLNVTDFATKLGVCKQTVYNWFNGRKIPITKVRLIEKTFGHGIKNSNNKGDESLD